MSDDMIDKMMNKILKLMVLFLNGAYIYMAIEICFRGYTFLLMGLCGGLAFVTVGGINEVIDWETPLCLQSIVGGIIITFYELLFGLLFNRTYQMWDYRNMPLNIEGQICVPFILIWCVLGCVAIILDDYLRYWLFQEEKPHYTIF